LRPTSFAEQKQDIERLKKLISGKIGLIVVDTMTMLYRLQRSFKEDDNHNHDLSLQMVWLNELARKHNIPILLTSQVYSSFASIQQNVSANNSNTTAIKRRIHLRS